MSTRVRPAYIPYTVFSSKSKNLNTNPKGLQDFDQESSTETTATQKSGTRSSSSNLPDTCSLPLEANGVSYDDLHLQRRQNRLITTGLSNRYRSHGEFIGDMLDMGQEYHHDYGYTTRLPKPVKKYIPRHGVTPKPKVYMHEFQPLEKYPLEKQYPYLDLKSVLGPPREPSPIPRFSRRTQRKYYSNSLTAMEIFQHFRRYGGLILYERDIQLLCMGRVWEMHRQVIPKSIVLTELLEEAEKEYYENQQGGVFHPRVSLDEVYEKLLIYKLSGTVKKTETIDKRPVYNLELPVHDPFVTRLSMAVVLGNMYLVEAQLAGEELISVMATAAYMGCHKLLNVIVQIFFKQVNAETYLKFYAIAKHYHIEVVEQAILKWLEMHLMLRISHTRALTEVPYEIMMRVMGSKRFFTYSEYATWQMLCTWIFLRMNPNYVGYPSFTAVVEYFRTYGESENKMARQVNTRSFLQRTFGDQYSRFFNEIHYHGISDPNQLKIIQLMNILSAERVFKLFVEHQSSVSTGSSMPLEMNIHTSPVRKGVIIKEIPFEHEHLFSINGFHFELKAWVSERRGRFYFQIIRKRSLDPAQYQIAENTVRIRRLIHYSIMIHYQDDNGEVHNYMSPYKQKMFDIEPPGNKGEMFSIDDAYAPLHVTYQFYFPRLESYYP